MQKELLVAHIAGENRQSLVSHLDEVAKLAERFASSAGLGSCGYLLGGLHDGGKASEVFQEYIRQPEAEFDQSYDAPDEGNEGAGHAKE